MVNHRKPKMASATGDTPYRHTEIGDCTCGYGFPDLLIGASSTTPVIVMVCPECGEQWELGLRETTSERMAEVLGERKNS